MIGAATAVAITTGVSPRGLTLSAVVLARALALSAAVLTRLSAVMTGTAPLSVLPAISAARAAALHPAFAAAVATAIAATAPTAISSGSRAAHASRLCELRCDGHQRNCHRERKCLFHRCIPCSLLPSDLEMEFEIED
jgi:hypothetical protein